MRVGDKIILMQGHYKGHPAMITEVYGNKCTATLIVVAEQYGTFIRNITANDYRKI